MEFGLNHAFFVLFAKHREVRPPAQGQSQGFKENGFSGPGLPGDHRQGAWESDLHLPDEGKIADVKAAEHIYKANLASLRPGARVRSPLFSTFCQQFASLKATRYLPGPGTG